jgi:hypothetical protein
MEDAKTIEKNIHVLINFCLEPENTYMRIHFINEYKQICMKNFSHIHEKYPTLFFKIIEEPSTFPLYRLKELLQYKEKIEKNEMNEKNVSEFLGQKYYNEFVKDNISKK